ncbi:2,3-butanediol dehydrogenase [Lacticigenium naphthae]|uniref:2,3-butanediol dehydrogenase n=1 Tax=Lacticigenium naphthae TaxID=515351 RepID=UPI000425A08D|nr:2,3-butanediol dehydrogenase [Lacticigenium naphthae]
MKAARWHGQRDVRVEDVKTPTVGAHQVKIAVKYAGICGSDLHEYLGGPIFIPVDKPHPYSNIKAPVTMGHEFAGEIVEVGADVETVSVGDRITVEPILAKNGLVGQYNLDENLGFVGLASNGGFAEFCVVDAGLVHLLPEKVDFEQGALTEPAAVALYAVRTSKLKVGDSAIVFGTGPIGLLIVEALSAAGATDIYAVELSPERQEKARKLGAIVIDPKEVDAVQAVREATNGGVDVAFEVTGVPMVLQQSIESVKNDGECVIVSIWEKPATIHPNEIVIKEKTVKGIIAYRHIFPEVLKLMEKGYFAKENYVTGHIKINDIVDKGFEVLANEKSQVKIMVSPE